MVHPYLRQSHNVSSKASTESDPVDSIFEQVKAMLPRLHAVVIGPGLGRDDLMQRTAARVIQSLRSQSLPFILDADGLYLASQQPKVGQRLH